MTFKPSPHPTPDAIPAKQYETAGLAAEDIVKKIMFKEETVFILGAGASWHYGYPTGEDLVESVINKAHALIKFIQLASPHEHTINCWPEYLKLENPEQPDTFQAQDAWQKVAQDCNQLIRALDYTKPIVIDNFLGQNPKLRSIGKLMVAWVILDCEKIFYHSPYPDELRRNINWKRLKEKSPHKKEQQEISNLDLSKYKDDWCRFILHRLAQKPKELSSNKISFITFNYDISLEYSLYDGLKHIESFNEKDVDSFLNSDRFLHMYGKIHDYFDDRRETLAALGKEPSFNEDRRGFYRHHRDILNRAYESSQKNFTIEDCHEPGNKSNCEEIHEKARKKVEKATHVYILGYGFDERNSKRLGLPQSLNHGHAQSKGKKVYFTNFGDKNLISKKAAKMFVGYPHVLLPPSYMIGPFQKGQSRSENYYEKSNKNVYEAIEQDFDFLTTDLEE